MSTRANTRYMAGMWWDELIGRRGGTCLAVEGDKVVLTQTGDVYVSYEDHLVVIFREDCIVYDV